MKMRNKGKVHPSPSSSSSSSSSSSANFSQNNNNKDALSVLKLLPAAILAMISVLSVEEFEVLAYMITRSLKSTNPSSFLEEKSKKNNPKKSSSAVSTHLHNTSNNKTPLFDCECFDCYTSFWFRWDSSPNRELIHHAIEAFEEHLNLGERSKKGKNRKKDKMGRRGLEKRLDFSEPEGGTRPLEIEETSTSFDGQCSLENEVSLSPSPPPPPEEEEEEASAYCGQVVDVVKSPQTQTAVVVRGGAAATAADNHKGLARKVLPDVLGLFNSRLWNLWSPNV